MSTTSSEVSQIFELLETHNTIYISNIYESVAKCLYGDLLIKLRTSGSIPTFYSISELVIELDGKLIQFRCRPEDRTFDQTIAYTLSPITRQRTIDHSKINDIVIRVEK